MDFIKYSKQTIPSEGIDVYSELSSEINLSRGKAKSVFWNFVMGGGDIRLGAASEGLTLDEAEEDDYEAYRLIGKSLRPILNHYVIQWFKILKA